MEFVFKDKKEARRFHKFIVESFKSKVLSYTVSSNSFNNKVDLSFKDNYVD